MVHHQEQTQPGKAQRCSTGPWDRHRPITYLGTGVAILRFWVFFSSSCFSLSHYQAVMHKPESQVRKKTVVYFTFTVLHSAVHPSSQPPSQAQHSEWVSLTPATDSASLGNRFNRGRPSPTWISLLALPDTWAVICTYFFPVITSTSHKRKTRFPEIQHLPRSWSFKRSISHGNRVTISAPHLVILSAALRATPSRHHWRKWG